jgi:hypothetical protein
LDIKIFPNKPKNLLDPNISKETRLFLRPRTKFCDIKQLLVAIHEKIRKEPEIARFAAS